MTKHIYSAELTGEGDINSAYVYLEKLPSLLSRNAIPILLETDNGNKKKWLNSKLEVAVQDQLEYQLNVHAVLGTSWKFTLTNTANQKRVVEISGVTGAKPKDGYNISIHTGSVIPN